MTRPRTVAALLLANVASAFAGEPWQNDPLWHDGLVEKATYAATRVVYGKPRTYTAVFFTNKEQHDRATLTKSAASKDTIEVFKHNQIEVVPTPNYDYKFTTTSHLTVGDLRLTRLDAASQEFCGTSFKQYLLTTEPAGGEAAYDYFGFSYMPESGRVTRRIGPADGRPIVAFNSLPIWLRDYPVAEKPTIAIRLLPDQKDNNPTPAEPVAAKVEFAGEDPGEYRLRLVTPAGVVGTFTFAKDRLRVMTRYDGADGVQTYELRSQERVNYWSRSE